MKCETKAKRRATLSICGLGMLDESELETIPGAVVFDKEKYVADKVESLKAPKSPSEDSGGVPTPSEAQESPQRPPDAKKQYSGVPSTVVFERVVYEDNVTGEAIMLVRGVREAKTAATEKSPGGKPYLWVAYGDEKEQALTCFDTALFDELKASVGSTIRVMLKVGKRGDSITKIVPEQNLDAEPVGDIA